MEEGLVEYPNDGFGEEGRGKAPGGRRRGGMGGEPPEGGILPEYLFVLLYSFL